MTFFIVAFVLVGAILSAHGLSIFSSPRVSHVRPSMGLFDGLWGGKKALSLKTGIGSSPTRPKSREEQYPEQYPAVKELQKIVVPGDNSEAKLVRPLLLKTQLESRKLKITYKASKDGWNAASFHKGVDARGATIIVARTSDGKIIGGYNPKGWAGLGENRPSIAAFLFLIEKPGQISENNYIKLRKKGGGGLAVSNDNKQSGIFFGPEDLVIPLEGGIDRGARSRLGAYYEALPGGGRSLLASELHFPPEEEGMPPTTSHKKRP
mmetsp:Transcript_7612/g.12211  ORF Transcript_7612/g.12211 Transcript_7612/m.12211 type:complete len:265 (+) Transcript_7612:82-876(+)